MQDLLFLAHRIPYPPDKGDKIRSWHMLRHLAARYRVHLGCFFDDPRDRAFEPVLKQLCGECCLVPLNPLASKLKSGVGLLSGTPLTLPYYRNRMLAEWVRAVAQRYRPTVHFYFSAAMAQYAQVARDRSIRQVIDFVDVDSQKWSEYARQQRWPKSWIYGREGRTLLHFERRVAQAMDASIFVSAAEATLFSSLAPESKHKTFHVNNGVDAAYFSPERSYDSPFEPGTAAIVFTGAMDYWPNIDAVTFFARSVMPGLRARCPDATFWIVGAKPAPAVLALRDVPGVTITGRVPDVRPYLAYARAVVAPLRIARGIQNKVLEAMAMAKPVVASPPAVEGIGGTVDRDYVVADDPDSWITRLAAVIQTARHEGLGERARHYVLATYDWEANLGKLDQIVNGSLAKSVDNGPSYEQRLERA